MCDFTPGPWEFVDATPWGLWVQCPDGKTPLHPSRFRGNTSDGVGEALANSRLIAAAPDLLEALEYVMDRLIDSHESDDSALKARAAIAKARGEE